MNFKCWILVISKRIKPFLGIQTIWIKIDNSGFFSDVLVVLAVLPALIALIVFVAPTVFVVVAIAAAVVVAIVAVVVVAIVAVVVAEVVAAADNSSFRIKNIVIYEGKPLHKLQGLFSKRLDIRDKLQYIG
jgi:hypothetical protein